MLARYFKTGKGEYGEGDVFWGITVPHQRQIAKKYTSLSLADLQELLMSKVHELRLTALLILVERYRMAELNERRQLIEFYLKNTRFINNWDLVDASAPYILGDYFFPRDKKILYTLCRSKNIWERRIAMLATYGFIKKGHFKDTLTMAELLLGDSHDLIHKAVGWMLREVGKKDQSAEIAFLERHHARMPRTMLRYAIEKFDEPTRQKYVKPSQRK